MIKFNDGINIDTSGPLRVLTLDDGVYVVGEGMLIPMNSYEEANNYIGKQKEITWTGKKLSNSNNQ